MAKVKVVKEKKDTKGQRRKKVFTAFEQVASVLGELSAADRRIVLNLINDWEGF